jgi:hypothetical protein
MYDAVTKSQHEWRCPRATLTRSIPRSSHPTASRSCLDLLLGRYGSRTRLPLDCRRPYVAAWNKSLVIGHSHGNILLLALEKEESLLYSQVVMCRSTALYAAERRFVFNYFYSAETSSFLVNRYKLFNQQVVTLPRLSQGLRRFCLGSIAINKRD